MIMRRKLGAAMGVRFHLNDFKYSEQGLQGDYYVHLDVAPNATKYFVTGDKRSLKREK